MESSRKPDERLMPKNFPADPEEMSTLINEIACCQEEGACPPCATEIFYRLQKLHLQQLAAAREEAFEKVSTAVDLMASMNGDLISANLLKATINRLANRQPGEAKL